MSISEHELRVARTARYFTAGDPGPSLRECWMVCHGYGQLAGRFVRAFEPLASPERCVVAPEGLSRFYLDEAQRARIGASWMTKEHRESEIVDYVEYLDAVYDQVIGEQTGIRLTAFGFSQGASTVSRWAALGRHHVQRLILWGGELPPDLELGKVAERFQKLEVVLVRGKLDEYITGKVVDSMVRRLDKHRVPHRLVGFDGGHEIDEAVLLSLR